MLPLLEKEMHFHGCHMVVTALKIHLKKRFISKQNI
jgi:hypothetical protein